MRRARVILAVILMAFAMNCCEDEKTTAPSPDGYSDAEKAEILRTYAPRLWFRTDEAYFPSSVEWAYPNLKRVLIGDVYWLVTKSPLLGDYFLEGPDYEDVYEHAFFKGNLESAVVYAFWVDKTVGPEEDKTDVVDLVYFVYYPFNRGKLCGGVRYENHVGDWEYLVVRIDRDDPDNPLEVALSAHSFVNTYDWAEIDKVEETHVVAHVAWGSHGIWKDEGDHHYATHGCDLHDYCNKGSSWDTWHFIRTFDFSARKGIAGNTWPVWMSEDFSEPGGDNPYDPAAGAVYRWGNPENYCWEYLACVLTTGPTGPISKGVFYSEGYE
ncbi:MAG TPA: hypothetical protein VMX58_10765 [Patescibacteria group bacterium]|nr:hypothetical protein [Patescibacteria group bacterium]